MFAGWVLGAALLIGGAPPEVETTGPTVPEARKDALARYGAGIWQAHRDRLLSAAQALEAAAKTDPNSTASLRELVRVYLQIGRDADAIRVARTVLEKDPHDAATTHTLSRLLFDAGELTEAVTLARQAAEDVNAEEHPDRALAVYRDLATLCDKTNNSAGAADALRMAAGLLIDKRKAVLASGLYGAKDVAVETADTYERLGKVLVKAGQADGAAEAFWAAHQLYADPKKANDPGAAARLDWNLSAAYAAKGNPAAALNHLEAFLKRRPLAVEPFERLVTLLNQAGRGAEVVPLLQAYAARDPQNRSLDAVLAAELARDPRTRRDAEAAFARLAATTADPKILRVMIHSHIATERAGLVIAEWDRAYQTLSGTDNAMTQKRAIAAETARAFADILRSESGWANAVLRAAADELRAGTHRSHRTWYALGTLAARHHRLDLAAVQLRQAVQTAPKETQIEAYSALLDVLWRARKPVDVADVCRAGLRTAEWVPPAVFNFHLAYALAELGDADEALTAADRAITQAGDADRLAFRLRKVSVLSALGRWDDAAALCQKLLTDFDAPADRTRIRYARASAYWGAKKYEASEAELRGILEADPDHAGACNDLGYHLADQGRELDEAERLVRRAVAVDRADRRKAGDAEPQNAAYLDSLAWVLFRRDKLTEARDLLEKVAALPDGAADGVVWDHLGDVRFRLGEKEKAKAAWERAVETLATTPRRARDSRLEDVRRKLKRLP